MRILVVSRAIGKLFCQLGAHARHLATALRSGPEVRLWEVGSCLSSLLPMARDRGPIGSAPMARSSVGSLLRTPLIPPAAGWLKAVDHTFTIPLKKSHKWLPSGRGPTDTVRAGARPSRRKLQAKSHRHVGTQIDQPPPGSAYLATPLPNALATPTARSTPFLSSSYAKAIRNCPLPTSKSILVHNSI